MIKLQYDSRQKKKASTLLSLALSELEASETLIESGLHREALVHMYFCCFYTSHSVLVHKLKSSPTHNSVESELHKNYGQKKAFPRRYVDLHKTLHALRTKFHYKVAHSPQPRMLERKLTVLQAYIKYAFKCVPKIETEEILRALLADNESSIRDFSYDVYCPKTYANHNRLTLWQPPFYLDIYGLPQIQKQSQKLMRNLRVLRSSDYVVGVNSKLDQYGTAHLLMLDIDSFDASVEEHLSQIGGVLLKSGRGFHFIGNKVIEGETNWRKSMLAIKRHKELKQYIDHDHVTMSLARGYSTLRVTTSKVKPHVPVFFKDL